MNEHSKGVSAMVGACMIWGLSPIFYKQLAGLAPLEVLAHRTIWSFVTFAGVLLVQGRLGELPRTLSSMRSFAFIALAAVMISANWFLFIYSIGAGRALEASIGYYIFPLMAVLTGFAVLRERIGRLQWVAVGLAAAAVIVLTIGLGVAPWISLILATTFAVYGLMKRWIDAGPVLSVTAEVLLLLPIALGYLVIWGQGGFTASLWQAALLVISGPLTATPLILFSYAAKRASMATIGLTQYLNPTLQFFCATVIFGEVITQWHAIALPLIWIALALYSIAAFRSGRGSTLS